MPTPTRLALLLLLLLLLQVCCMLLKLSNALLIFGASNVGLAVNPSNDEYKSLLLVIAAGAAAGTGGDPKPSNALLLAVAQNQMGYCSTFQARN